MLVPSTAVWPTVSDCARLSMLGLAAASALPPDSERLDSSSCLVAMYRPNIELLALN